MARARFIRPEFFTDTKLSDMPMSACMLFAGIWCQADLNGVFEYDARHLRGLIFPMREDVSTSDVAEWLGMLRSAGMVSAGCRHNADSESERRKVWGVVTNWTRHQKISGSEAKWGSKRPKPCDINTAGSVPCSGVAPCHAQAPTLTPSLSPTPTQTQTRADGTTPRTFPWIRTASRDPARQRDNEAALEALVDKYGADKVAMVAERLAFKKGKVYPDDKELLAGCYKDSEEDLGYTADEARRAFNLPPEPKV